MLSHYPIEHPFWQSDQLLVAQSNMYCGIYSRNYHTATESEWYYSVPSIGIYTCSRNCIMVSLWGDHLYCTYEVNQSSALSTYII